MFVCSKNTNEMKVKRRKRAFPSACFPNCCNFSTKLMCRGLFYDSVDHIAYSGKVASAEWVRNDLRRSSCDVIEMLSLNFSRKTEKIIRNLNHARWNSVCTFALFCFPYVTGDGVQFLADIGRNTLYLRTVVNSWSSGVLKCSRMRWR